MSPVQVRPLVIGVGNRYRGDDGIGPVVVDLVAQQWPDRVDTAVVEGDLSTLPMLWSAEHEVVVVDAAVVSGDASATAEPGTVVEFDGLGRHWPIGGERPPLSTHGIGLAAAIGLARRLDRLPASLIVLAAVANGRSLEPGASMSGAVGSAADAVVNRIGEILNLNHDSPTLGSEAASDGNHE